MYGLQSGGHCELATIDRADGLGLRHAGQCVKPQICLCGFNFMPATSSSSSSVLFRAVGKHLPVIDRERACDDPDAGR
jgi:hypothetical protein